MEITIYENINSKFLDAYSIVDENIDKNFSINLETYLTYLKDGQYNCYSHESEFYYISLFLFVLLVMSLIGCIYSIISIKKNKKKLITNQGEIEVPVISPKKELKRDLKVSPFLKEGALILISQVFYFLTQISSFLIFANLFEYGNINNIPYIDTIIDVLRCSIPLANTLILFINLNRKIITDNSLKTAIQYIFFGIIFASFEALLIYDLSRSGDFFINLILSFLPKNLFFAMGIYALIYYLLFKTPLFLKNRQIRIIFFRLLSIPLIGFLIFSIIYSPLVNLELITGNIYLNVFLASISFSYTFIALGYIFLKKIIDTYFIHKYGTTNFERYERGNRYQYILNSAFIFLLIIVFILSLLLSSDKNLTSLDLNNFIYIPCVFPFIFFYKKRLFNRNVFIDLGSGVAYFISTCISYLLIFLIVTSG